MSKASDLREQSAKHYQKAQESFERCDTDGFVSQWAGDINGRLCSVRADIADNDGKAFCTMLIDSDGELVPAKMINGNYGPVWILSPEMADKYGRKFIPVGKRSRVQKQKGLSEDSREVPAYARIQGNGGTGLGGAVSCYVSVNVDYKALGWDF